MLASTAKAPAPPTMRAFGRPRAKSTYGGFEVSGAVAMHLKVLGAGARPVHPIRDRYWAAAGWQRTA